MTKATKRIGRPDLQGSTDLDLHLMETAARLFAEHGYEGTSMDQVAAAAGAGKQSLYRRYANKAALFEIVFSEHMLKERLERWRANLASITSEGLLEIDQPLDDLHRIAKMAFNFMLEPKTLSVYALLVAEGRRFPNLHREISEIGRTLENQITRRIISAQSLKLFRSNLDPNSSRHLVALINSWPLAQSLLNPANLDTDAKRETYFNSAWQAFVDSKSNDKALTWRDLEMAQEERHSPTAAL